MNLLFYFGLNNLLIYLPSYRIDHKTYSCCSVKLVDSRVHCILTRPLCVKLVVLEAFRKLSGFTCIECKCLTLANGNDPLRFILLFNMLLFLFDVFTDKSVS